MGAGIVECDVAFTKDRELVCRHAQCDLHTTTNILAVPELAAKCSEPFTPASGGGEASAKCCTSDLTLSEFRSLKGKMDAANEEATTVEDYVNATADWRTDLYSPGTLMTHAESIALFQELGVKFTPELKTPEVAMPFDGDYSQEVYAAAIDRRLQGGRGRSGRRLGAVVQRGGHPLLDRERARVRPPSGLPRRPQRRGCKLRPEWTRRRGCPRLQALADEGVEIVAPPLWMLVTTENGKIVPSAYAKEAKAAGARHHRVVPGTLRAAQRRGRRLVLSVDRGARSTTTATC